MGLFLVFFLEFACPSDQVQCDSGECIQSSFYCDGFDDCADRSDELSCCTFTQFTCANGRCLDFRQRCDGINDCRDNSDEEDCIGVFIQELCGPLFVFSS